jgi:NADH-quinone oxidoreductase subunit J
MSATAIIFYILAVLIITFGLLTVVARRIFRAAVFLLFSLIGMAGIYLLMEMEFIAAIQIIVYVGGIVVLLIFSIFLTHQAGEKLPKKLVKRIIRGIALALAGFAMVTWILLKYKFVASTEKPIEDTVENIGRQLLDYQSHGYVFPFEVVSVLLLAALIGSITIAMKVRKSSSRPSSERGDGGADEPLNNNDFNNLKRETEI